MLLHSMQKSEIKCHRTEKLRSVADRIKMHLFRLCFFLDMKYQTKHSGEQFRTLNHNNLHK